MKYRFFILLLVALTVILAGCKDNKIVTSDPTEEEKNNTLETLENAYEMPEPFGSEEVSIGGDENNAFYSPCEWLFDGVPGELVDLVDYSDFEGWRVKHNIFAKAPSSLRDYVNVYSFIVEFDIPDKDVLSALSVYLQSDDQSIAISQEEMNIILSKDEATIAERFASQYSIVIGEQIYSPQWVYENSIDAYKNAGITPEMLKEKLPWYWDIKFTEEARKAFEDKLGVYLGEAVSLLPSTNSFYMSDDERQEAEKLLVDYQNYCSEQYENNDKILKPKDYFSKEEYELLKKNERYHVLMFEAVEKQEFYIGEYSLEWLASHTIQDYETANITILDLEKLLLEMSDFKESREYEWIKSCYDRMLEDSKITSTTIS